MNRNMDILFGVIAPTDSAFADDITVGATSSTSLVSRAEVVADFTSAIGAQRLAPLLDRHQLRGPASGSGGQCFGAQHTRGRLLLVDRTLDEALDRYTFKRDAYLQHRNAQVQNGSDGGEEPPLPASESAEACIAHAQE